MGKAKKGDAVQQVAQPLLVVGPRGAKYTGKDGTKHGAGGTHGTWAAVQAAVAANGGTITYDALRALCAAQGDKGYAAYAVRNMWLVPSA